MHLIIYNGRSIPVPVGYIKLHKTLFYDKTLISNKYQSKDDQNYVFRSVESSIEVVGYSGVEEKMWNLYLMMFMKNSINKTHV